MAYMRDPHYVWSDGEHIHIDGVQMPLAIFDELVAMRWAQLSEAEKNEAELAAIDRWTGNFGCDALRRSHGLQTALEVAMEAATKGRDW